ncbi:MAG: cell division protein FtsL [Burkholderiaceae bacterium]|nr:cell division protein FtsL [Burkholderiaceae bacterium]MCX7902082.1 cell division protein FtsL [Burkholderiaceae bacterium]
MRALCVLLAAALVASAFGIVTAQHRARALFVDLERAQQQAAALAAERSRLRIERARLLQPAAVDAAARRLGLRPIESAQTVFMPFSGSTRP